jgi:hypothetical protein
MKIRNCLAAVTALAGALVSSAAFSACLDEAQVADLVAAGS